MKQKADLEANVMKQRADLEASLHFLQCQREAAAAEAEVTAYEEAEAYQRERCPLPNVDEEPLSAVQRTSDYIHQQSELVSLKCPTEYKAEESYERQSITLAKPGVESYDVPRNTQPFQQSIKKESTTHPHCTLNHTARADEYIPEPRGTQDFTRYLIKR